MASKILAVDDDAKWLRILSLYLRERGHEVVTQKVNFSAIGKASILGEAGGFCKVVAERDGAMLEKALALSGKWKESDLGWRESSWFGLRNALHLASMAAVVFLTCPSRRGAPARRFTVVDVVLAVAIAACAWYIFEHYLIIHREQFSIPFPRDLVFAGLTVVLLLEAARRAAGWVIPTIAAFFIFYTLGLGQYIPGAFYYSGAPYERVLFRLALTDEAIFGLVANISATYVFTFILFGAFLIKSGAGAFVIDLALALTGRFRGGAAHAAVVASGLVGSITGSAVANTVTSGAFTIPLMKRIGYSPRNAAAIEAAASTGGQVLPPIMGAGAFIMAEITGIPYTELMVAALIPNRSASSMIMIVASGTSTPTSMTVVETRICASPVRKRRIAASFSSDFMRPWMRSTVSSGNTSEARWWCRVRGHRHTSRATASGPYLLPVQNLFARNARFFRAGTAAQSARDL